MADFDDIPPAPDSRPDLKETWALVAKMEASSNAQYQATARRISTYVTQFPAIGLAELAQIHQRIDAELKQLETTQNALIFTGIGGAVAAARLGFGGKAADAQAESAMVNYLINAPMKDGLNLSARLWRIHAGAAKDMKTIVDIAVQRGWDAENATQHALEVTPELHAALKEAGSDAVAKRLKAGLLTDPNNARMKFKRVLRTEINRAHGERYKQLVREDPDAIGLRFMLSPRHPRPDIRDTHASADLYDLGTGVYPVNACPWPAHPNTFSYVEVVYGALLI